MFRESPDHRLGEVEGILRQVGDPITRDYTITYKTGGPPLREARAGGLLIRSCWSHANISCVDIEGHSKLYFWWSLPEDLVGAVRIYTEEAAQMIWDWIGPEKRLNQGYSHQEFKKAVAEVHEVADRITCRQTSKPQEASLESSDLRLRPQ